jgi:hypothetical protein
LTADDGYSEDVLTRIYNVHWGDEGLSVASLSIIVSTRPTGFYKDDTPTVATLSVKNLPLLDPSTFKVNWPANTDIPPPPFMEEVDIGGSTQLTMPDGESGTLKAIWSLRQQPFTGLVGAGVSYDSSTTQPGIWKPFLGQNIVQIKVVMNLPPLDFLASISLDNHYEWVASANAIIPGMRPPDLSKAGRAESGETLTCILNAIMDPPGVSFTAANE